MISEGLWRRRFGGAASAIGGDVQVDGELYTVVGVAPASFAEVWRHDIWIPLGLVADPTNRGTNYLLTLGRLRPGVTIDGARRQMAELAAQMSRDHPQDDYTFTVRDVHDVVTEGATRGLWVLLGATVLLLLISCTNVANLLLARSIARERDLAVRASLGAGRRQLVSQVLGETVALGVVGSVAGAALAWALLRTFVAMAPPNFPRLAAIAVDLRVLAITTAVGVAAGLIAGLLPALNLFRSDLNAASHGGATRGATARRARSAGRLLVVSEMALALALVTTAGVMVKSLLRLQDVDLGLTREPVLTFAVACRHSSPKETRRSRGSRPSSCAACARSPVSRRRRPSTCCPWARPATTASYAGPIRWASVRASPSRRCALSWTGTSTRWACGCWPAVRSTSGTERAERLSPSSTAAWRYACGLRCRRTRWLDRRCVRRSTRATRFAR